MAHAVVILNAVAKQQLYSFWTCLPPRGHAASRRLPAEICKEFIGLVKDIPLLLKGHVGRILMRVSM
jgi:hypothetical protein